MGGSRLLQLVAGLLAALLPAAAAAVGMQPGAPCEPTLLATQLAVFCAPDVPTAPCCVPVVFAVDIGGDIPCICRVAAEPELAAAGFSAAHLLTLYTSCGGLRTDGAHLAAACEGPAPPAAIVSSGSPPPPASTAPRHRQPAHDAPPPPPPSSDKPSSAPPQEDDGATAHTMAAPAQAATSTLAPAAAGALPPHSPAFIFVAAADGAPSPPPSSEKASSPPPNGKAAPAPSPPPEERDSDAKNISRVLGYIFTAVLYLSPLPTMVIICRNGDVGEHKVDGYIVSFTSFLIWVLYGVSKPLHLSIVIINAIGAGVEAIYIGIFVWFSSAAGRMWAAVILVSVGGILAFTSFGIFFSSGSPQDSLAILADASSFAMYLGPTRQIFAMWNVKHVRKSSFVVAVASILSGASWTTYAHFSHNIFLLIPNVAGIVSGVAQLCLFLVIKLKYQHQ